MPRRAQAALFPSPVPVCEGPFAHVVFSRPLDRPYVYGVPPELHEQIAAGKRVLAPLGRGNRPAVGYCVDLSEQAPDHETKAILRILDDEPLLTPALIRLTNWLSDYYLCSWGQVLHAIVPAGARQRAGTRAKPFLQIIPVSEQTEPLAKLTPAQERVLAILLEHNGPVEGRRLAAEAKCGPAVLNGLVRKGYARRVLQRVEQPRTQDKPLPREEPLVLNLDQLRAQSAIEQALNAGGFQAFLLHGVTGSGKTEIYLQAIEQTVRQGKEALVLVPEISLTPQTIRRFRGRFPHVAVLHSHLSDAERGGHWRRIALGQVQVIVGARSAIFAPAHKLGLIVVDEEHETSFKQETTPRYHARDVAVMRARMEGIPIVLGSATPSLESWHNAQRGQYTLLGLPKRVLDRPLPDVGLIDLRHEAPAKGRYRALSPRLEQAMRDALGKGGQVILLLNRRGFSTFIHCPACGHVVKCKFCDVALTHHHERETAMCHYCGFETEPPTRCPECGLGQIRYQGLGTEKLEAEITHKFPGVPAARMDSDSMKRPGSHAKVLDAFKKSEVRILFGTQMIAKGLDFPNVTLVGVVNADTALFFPDFRAAERTFQLLAQVAGRTGRGESGGRVLVQTFNSDHPSIALASRHDYMRFAELELGHRKEHLYPPFARMARIILRGKEQEAMAAFAERLAECFRRALEQVAAKPASGKAPMLRLLGPAEAPLTRLQGYYRYHFQVQSTSVAALHDLLKQALGTVKPPEGIDWSVDVDPQSML
jgi:primosomal protein N' (replication factor Y)